MTVQCYRVYVQGVRKLWEKAALKVRPLMNERKGKGEDTVQVTNTQSKLSPLINVLVCSYHQLTMTKDRDGKTPTAVRKQ